MNIFFACVLSFLSGFSLMSLEMVAPRLIAPILGNSIYTWTSIIGFVLLGLSLGNYFGGRIADRGYSPILLGKLYLATAFLISAINVILNQNKFISAISWSVVWDNLLISALLFFLPALLLAMTQPIIIKGALNDQTHLGRSYGQISASSSIGSLLGVFLTGFYLISHVGSKNLIQIIFLIILALSVIIFIKERKRNLVIIALFLGLIFYAVSRPQTDGPTNLLSEKESNYYKIRVAESDLANYGKSRVMMIDLDLHSIEPENKSNSYTDIYPLFKYIKPKISDVLVVGGGAYTLPKNILSYYPNSNITVIEIDPEVTTFAEKYFNLDSQKIKTVWGDARTKINNDKNKYDLIYWDAYNSIISVPGHLLTKEYNDSVKSRLNEGGIYALNFIASKNGDKKMLSAVYNTFIETFPQHYLLSFPPDKNGVQNFNLIGINSEAAETYQKLISSLSADPETTWISDLLVPIPQLIARESDLVLRDNFYPVESLMSSVIKTEYQKLRDFNNSLYY